MIVANMFSSVIKYTLSICVVLITGCLSSNRTHYRNKEIVDAFYNVAADIAKTNGVDIKKYVFYTPLEKWKESEIVYPIPFVFTLPHVDFQTLENLSIDFNQGYPTYFVIYITETRDGFFCKGPSRKEIVEIAAQIASDIYFPTEDMNCSAWFYPMLGGFWGVIFSEYKAPEEWDDLPFFPLPYRVIVISVDAKKRGIIRFILPEISVR